MADAVLVDLAAKVRPGVPVIFLDTGYHFVETIGTRDAIESVYDVRVLNVTPEHTVAEQDELLGKDLFARNPHECCRLRKVVPLGKTLRGYSAWVTGLRRVDAPTRANAPLVSFDETFKLVKVNPLAAWTDQDVQEYIADNDVLVNPLVREGYPSIGCAPCTAKPAEGADPRSGRWQGAGQDRMRVARLRRPAPATMQSAAMLRSGAIEAPPATMQSAAMRWGHLPLAEESGTIAPQLVLTAHGSKDPRSAANARAIAGRLARMRPGLDVRVAFCELNSPNLVDVLNRCRGAAVVTPLLLADAYHARVDIPAQIASCRVGHRVRQASVLGEDIRLVSALHERLTELGVSPFDHTLGVVVLAIGSSHPAANARTSTVASRLAEGTQWAAVTTAFITRPEASLADATDRLRRHGARRMVIAPWLLAPGILSDRVRGYAREAGIAMAQPLGAHPMVAATMWDRYRQAVAGRIAA
ncbi:cobalamin (vitamin b12) biosynthesis cbix protein [Mycobacterium tuberculosis RGTB423]|nr:cobalamin (vitamin b12) biosynthesis cbix protein [Mycobacterium tuberculosis RGTB423]